MPITSNKYTPQSLPAQQGAKIVTLQNMANFTAMMQNWTDDRLNELPAERYLDAVNTKVVSDFNWATMSVNYPGASDPNLDGKTVLVLAIKNEGITNSTLDSSDDTIAYYFVDFADLVDAYVEDNTTTKAVDVTISGNKVSAELNLHTKVGAEKENAITLETDGAYVPDLSDDLTALQTLVGNKADNSTSTLASGLCKDIDDINEEIGDKAVDAVMDTDGVTIITPAKPATGIYKYIDDKVKDTAGKLTYATTADINALFN